MNKLIITAALVVFSMASQASTFSEERQLQYIQEHQSAVATYAEKNGKPMPEVQDYKYGMKIDVAKFVRQSRDPRTCQVYPRLMTFEDSEGTLKTVRYSMYSQCINNK
ncbi:DUF2790 domain-containing protein [Pseudomonas sichuanensis]|uniref:DUF2790 domain-containing protein n=1 Tax=Pseudomonas sichuanensis TaxID=2213015 RepID=UPI002ACB0704|nr:DUF2790 domain-containing protein [Pseudomonas sichuanensis]